MKRSQRINIGSWLSVCGVVAIFALAPFRLLGQSSGPEVDICTLYTVDAVNDVEELVCIVGDEARLYSVADVNSYAQNDSQNWPSGDPYVTGLGSQHWLLDSNNNLVVDSGMQYGDVTPWDGSPDTLSQAESYISIDWPQLNAPYTAYGFYSECYDPTGGGQTCSFTSPMQGFGIQATVTGSSGSSGSTNAPTLSLTTSNASLTYGQPVTFTASISAGPAGSLTFYDGGTAIGTASINGGTASITVNTMAGGYHSITAVWPGDSTYGTATSNAIAESVDPTVYSYCIPGPTNPSCTSATSGYASNSNIAAYIDSINGSWGLSYDRLNRLTAASVSPSIGGNSSFGWTYDSFGNRLAQTGDGGMNVVTQSGNDQSGVPHNQVTSTNARGVPWVSPPSIYDNAGNLQSDGANQYLYDADGHVCAVFPLYGGTPVQYIYDGSGKRVAKGTITGMNCDTTSNGFTLTAQYILGPDGEQMTEIAYNNGSSTWKHTNVSAGGAVATYLNDGAGPHFRLTDWLGTTRVQTNSVGTPELYCQNLPFGDTPAQCVAATEQFFTGYERDADSGNDYAQARYYASSMGRFLSPDPSGLLAAKPANPQSWNLYSYVLNNPLIGIDPTGLDCIYAGLDGQSVDYIDHESNSDQCGSSGGTWLTGYVNEDWAKYNQRAQAFEAASEDNGQVNFAQFQAGAQTDDNGNCLSGCGGYGFASASADSLLSQYVGNTLTTAPSQDPLSGLLHFMVNRDQPVIDFWKAVAGPLNGHDNWAGPGGMGPPRGTGDWKAALHDYNWDQNGIKGNMLLNPFLSLATSKALIQSNWQLMQTGGFQGAKEKLIFGFVNAFQWYANSWK